MVNIRCKLSETMQPWITSLVSLGPTPYSMSDKSVGFSVSLKLIYVIIHKHTSIEIKYVYASHVFGEILPSQTSRLAVVGGVVSCSLCQSVFELIVTGLGGKMFLWDLAIMVSKPIAWKISRIIGIALVASAWRINSSERHLIQCVHYWWNLISVWRHIFAIID